MTRRPLTEQQRKFGRGRVAGCVCTYHFTCRPCLDAAAKRDKLEAPEPGADPMTRHRLTDDEAADEHLAEEQARNLAACPTCGADTRHEQCRTWCDTSAALYD